nr:hypothetical protein [Crucivirus sp.]
MNSGWRLYHLSHLQLLRLRVELLTVCACCTQFLVSLVVQSVSCLTRSVSSLDRTALCFRLLASLALDRLLGLCPLALLVCAVIPVMDIAESMHLWIVARFRLVTLMRVRNGVSPPAVVF